MEPNKKVANKYLLEKLIEKYEKLNPIGDSKNEEEKNIYYKLRDKWACRQYDLIENGRKKT